MNLEISKLSHQKSGKKKNGDFCEFKVIEKDNLVVLTLGDGVGSNPCDWKASKITCQKFIDEFVTSSKKEIPERIIESIKKTNLEILSETGACKSMKSTFCGVIWDFNKNHIYYTNIGDSRIYQLANNNVEQLSRDEVKSVIVRKKDGKPIISSGIVVVAERITNAIGSEGLSIEIKEQPDTCIDAIILTSDGFHGLSSSFNKELTEIVTSLNLENSLEQLYNKYEDRQKDDMTILVARKNNNLGRELNVIKSLLNDEDTSNISNLELARSIFIGLEIGIKERKISEVEKLLTIRNKNMIDFGRQNIGKLISLMVKVDFQNSDIYQELLRIMRGSKY